MKKILCAAVAAVSVCGMCDGMEKDLGGGMMGVSPSPPPLSHSAPPLLRGAYSPYTHTKKTHKSTTVMGKKSSLDTSCTTETATSPEKTFPENGMFEHIEWCMKNNIERLNSILCGFGSKSDNDKVVDEIVDELENYRKMYGVSRLLSLVPSIGIVINILKEYF